jgi:cyclophilin family peptidyl-prolyl cis-trans isomerase
MYAARFQGAGNERLTAAWAVVVTTAWGTAWATVWTGTVTAAQPPAAAARADVGASRAAFAVASKDLKALLGELTLLEAQYQQPEADKQAIIAKAQPLEKKLRAASERLEETAFALADVDPKNKEAGEVTGAVVARMLQGDAPAKALEVVERLDRAGAADGNVLLMAATAAMVLSRLDAAEAWLAKAGKVGSDANLEDLRGAIERERPKVAEEMTKRQAEAQADDLPRVKLATSAGDVVVELFENEAPNTVANFIALVDRKFYDGTPFHRVIGGFMAQGGDPTGTGRGGPGHAIECECGAPGSRRHFLGSLSMAHAGKNTGGSQFFLTFRPTEHLDGKHTVFGRVISGFDVLPKLIRTQDEQGRPLPGLTPDTIVKAEVVRRRNHPYEPKVLPDPRAKPQ